MGRFIKYYLKGDINNVLVLMKSYHTSIWNKLSERLAHLFISVSEGSHPSNDPQQDEKDNTNVVSKDEKENSVENPSRYACGNKGD
jgi:hypothetical protein